jgi:acetyl-CoA carboxylase beta subunit
MDCRQQQLKTAESQRERYMFMVVMTKPMARFISASAGLPSYCVVAEREK